MSILRKETPWLGGVVCENEVVFQPEALKKLGTHYQLTAEVVQQMTDNLDNLRYSVEKRLYAEAIKSEEDYLIDQIIETAKKNGVTDLYILNEDFIKEVIKKATPVEVSHGKSCCVMWYRPGQNYCPICGQALKRD